MKIVGIILVVVILLFVGVMVVQHMQESADLTKAQAQAASAEETARLDAHLTREQQRYIELTLGPVAAKEFERDMFNKSESDEQKVRAQYSKRLVKRGYKPL